MESSQLYGIATIAYIAAMVLYISYLAFRKQTVGLVATTATVVGFVSQTAAFVLRGFEINRLHGMGFMRSIPMSNLYESLIFFVWCLILGYLIIEWKYKNRSFGAFITPIAAAVLAFIAITGVSSEIKPLIPALQSNWLLAHVTMSFIAYAAYGISFATAIMYLAMTTEDRKSVPYLFWTITLALSSVVLIAMAIDFVVFKVASFKPGEIQNYLFKATFRNSSGMVVLLSVLGAAAFVFAVWRYGYLLGKLLGSFALSAEQLDDLTYRCIAIGFPIFTLGGLIFGAIWADQAWGKYWTWDPKETWSLITWFVYAFYLHARQLRGWRGAKIAIVAVVGFACTIFTYLGVNLLLSGLHAYGGL